MTFSVWELTGLELVSCRSRFELCVVILMTEAQFLDDTGSSLSVRGGSEREPNSEDLHVTFVARAGTGRTRRPVLKNPLGWRCKQAARTTQLNAASCLGQALPHVPGHGDDFSTFPVKARLASSTL